MNPVTPVPVVSVRYLADDAARVAETLGKT
jgi:hypothetical protein